MSKQCAVPLCLPNNCRWDEQTGEYSKTGDARDSLYVVDTALERLRSTKGPVCVVSIAGPCRKGKSYILSKAFDQGEVFPLGHEMDPETMGIWMWIVPEKFKDTSGQEFTVVLLDSEGIDAASSESSDDHCIFTLTVLLSSVLIYNSAGVPTRSDLEGLDFILKLSQRIQLRSTAQKDSAQGKSTEEDADLFRKTFPFFIWLLRDVVFTLPRGFPDIKNYFQEKIFKSSSNSDNDQASIIGEGILKFFSGFDAFKLPLPSGDENVLLNLNNTEVQQDINKSFVRGVQEFKAMLKPKLAPKHSFNDGEYVTGFNDGEYVTGEALAVLVNIYVDALNTRGAVPNVQSAWETFVHTKCSEAKIAALQVYESTMTSRLDGVLPCDSDKICQVQQTVFKEGDKTFEEETFGVSARSNKKYKAELTKSMENVLKRWQEDNNRLTEEYCRKLLRDLKEQHLGPVLKQLNDKDGASMSSDEIREAYSAIENGFQLKARGARDVREQVLSESRPKLQSKMKKDLAHLQQLKDLKAEEEKKRREEANARLEQERRIQEEQEANARLEQERRMQEQQIRELEAQQERDRRHMEKRRWLDLLIQLASNIRLDVQIRGSWP